MPRDFYPRRDQDILTWTKVFSAQIMADYEQYNISQEQAESYALTQGQFAEALKRTLSPQTRTPAGIALKNEIRARLEAETRMLARLARACPTVTGAMRLKLGLSVAAGRRAMIPPPQTAPTLVVQSVEGHVMSVQVWNSDSERRGKPPGVQSAAIYSCVAALPSQEPSPWRLHAHLTRMTGRIVFPESIPPGSKVWLQARWITPRQQEGPASAAASAYIQFGGRPRFTNVSQAA